MISHHYNVGETPRNFIIAILVLIVQTIQGTTKRHYFWRELIRSKCHSRMTEFLADAGERITILKVVCRRVINRYRTV